MLNEPLAWQFESNGGLDPPRPTGRQRWIHALKLLAALATLVLFVFLAFFELFFVPIPVLEEGQPAPRTIRAPHEFTFEAAAAYNAIAKERLQSFIPLYIRDAKRTEQILSAARARAHQIVEAVQSGRNIQEKIRKLQARLVGQVDAAILEEIAKNPRIDEVMRSMLTFLGRIVEAGVMADADEGPWTGIRVAAAEGEEPSSEIVRNYTALSKARAKLENESADIILALPEESVRVLARTLAREIQPNLIFSATNKERITAYLGPPPPTVIVYRRGDVILRQGNIVTAMDQMRLSACAARTVYPPLYALAALFVFGAICVIYVHYTRSFYASIFAQDTGTKYLMILFAVLITVFLAKMLFLLTSASGFAIPVGVVAILVAKMVDRRIALLTSFMAALALTIVTYYSFSLFLFYAISSAVCVMATLYLHRLWHFVPFSLGLGALNVVLVRGTSVLEHRPLDAGALSRRLVQAYLGAAYT